MLIPYWPKTNSWVFFKYILQRCRVQCGVCVGTDSYCMPYLSFIGLVMTVNVNHSAYVFNGIVCVPEYSYALDASFEIIFSHSRTVVKTAIMLEGLLSISANLTNQKWKFTMSWDVFFLSPFLYFLHQPLFHCSPPCPSSSLIKSIAIIKNLRYTIKSPVIILLV